MGPRSRPGPEPRADKARSGADERGFRGELSSIFLSSPVRVVISVRRCKRLDPGTRRSRTHEDRDLGVLIEPEGNEELIGRVSVGVKQPALKGVPDRVTRGISPISPGHRSYLSRTKGGYSGRISGS